MHKVGGGRVYHDNSSVHQHNDTVLTTIALPRQQLHGLTDHVHKFNSYWVTTTQSLPAIRSPYSQAIRQSKHYLSETKTKHTIVSQSNNQNTQTNWQHLAYTTTVQISTQATRIQTVLQYKRVLNNALSISIYISMIYIYIYQNVHNCTQYSLGVNLEHSSLKYECYSILKHTVSLHRDTLCIKMKRINKGKKYPGGQLCRKYSYKVYPGKLAMLS